MQGQRSWHKIPMYSIGGALQMERFYARLKFLHKISHVPHTWCFFHGMGRFYARSKVLPKISPCIVLTCYTGIILHVA